MNHPTRKHIARNKQPPRMLDAMPDDAVIDGYTATYHGWLYHYRSPSQRRELIGAWIRGKMITTT